MLEYQMQYYTIKMFYKNLRSWNVLLRSSTTLDNVIINPLDSGSNGKSGDHSTVALVLLLCSSLHDWSTDDFSNDSKRSIILYHRSRIQLLCDENEWKMETVN